MGDKERSYSTSTVDKIGGGRGRSETRQLCPGILIGGEMNWELDIICLLVGLIGAYVAVGMFW
jgi:hypothetical protein